MARRTRPFRLRRLQLVAYATLPGTGIAEARDAAPALIHVGVPAGFADLAGPQELVVDVFFQARRLGQAEILAAPGEVRFRDPAAVVALLPEPAKQRAVEAALTSSLTANEALACGYVSGSEQCGALTPRTVGLIFDRERFRLDLFVNPALLPTGAPFAEPYIEVPGSAPSLINAISGSLSGSSDAPRALTLQDRLIIASGRGRVVGDLFFDSNRGLQADQAMLQADLGGYRYSGGLLYTPGTDLVGRRRLLGLGVASQIDTRRDKELLAGTPLIVTLGQRAKVEILENGRVLSSRIYEPGNQWLDTRQLPEGSYDVVLRITEAGAPAREERRFFTRSPRIAQTGHDIAFVYAGLLSPEKRRGLLSISSEPVLEAGYGRRIAPSAAVDAGLFVTRAAAFGQFGGNLFTSHAQLRLAALVSTTGAFGGLAQVLSQGAGPLGFMLDLRRVVADAGRTLDGLDTPEQVFINPLNGDPRGLRAGRATFSQITGYLGFSRGGRQLGLSGSYRSESGSPRSYSLGPNLRWDLVQRGPFRLSFNAEGAFTERGRNGFVGLSLIRTGFGGSVTTSRFGVRQTREEGQSSETRAVGAITAGAQIENALGGRLELGAGLERDHRADLIATSGTFALPQGSLRADGLREMSGRTQYALGFRTSLTATEGGLALQGDTASEGAVMVEVVGAAPADRFEVLVDDAVVGTLQGAGTLPVALVPYREYGVRIRPVASAAVGYDSQTRQLSLYPGTVARLVWHVEPRVAVFGRLELPSGEAVANALVQERQSLAQTDDRGYFQIEVGSNTTLEVRLPDGRRCTARVGQLAREGSFSSLDTLTCMPDYHSPTVIAGHQ